MSKQTLILLYGGRSAEREVSVLSAESVMRAVDYSAFEVKTYFITQSGDFIKTHGIGGLAGTPTGRAICEIVTTDNGEEED